MLAILRRGVLFFGLLGVACLANPTQAETLDLSGSEFGKSHPNVPPEVCPVCLAIKEAKAGLATGKYTEVLVSDVSGAVSALRIMRASKLDLPILVKRSNNPAVGIGRLETKFKKVELLHDIPQTQQEARAIHGEDVKFVNREMKAYRTYAIDRSELATADFSVQSNDIRSLATKGEYKDKVLAQVSNQTADDLTIVVGHVNNQGKLVFSDGSEVALSDLKGKGTTWVLGCQTTRFTAVVPSIETTVRLNYREALELANAAITGFANGKTLGQGISILQGSGKVIAVTSIIGGSILLTEVIE